VQEVRKVSVPMSESRKSPQTEYRVHRTLNNNTSIIGDEPQNPNINVRIGMAARQREKAINATRFDQRWFGNNTREDAMTFLRVRIGKAKNRVMVADPYFGVLQIPQYLLAITSHTVKVTILTSRLAFEGIPSAENNEGDMPEDDSNISLDSSRRLEIFSTEIAQIKDAGNTDFEVKVLPSKSPDLHDRFLVVDEDVWFLGNSLNTLGTRASMIIKLPNPDEVLKELEQMLIKSKNFDIYHLSRIKALENAKRNNPEPIPVNNGKTE